MDPVKLTLEFYIDEPVSNDIDTLTDVVQEAITEAVGELDYVIQDFGLSFEIDDA